MTETERKHLCPQPEKFPVELIAEIIAIVADGTQECNPKDDENHPFWTLAVSSLVSRTWTAICRPHIFHTLSISWKTIPRLSFLHFDAPHLSEYIRIVHIWWNDDTCTALAWFPECFARLKNLRALHLENGISSLSKAPAPLSAGIVSMLAAPRLCKLVLNDWGFASDASDLLSMLPATLEELKLEGIMETHVTEKAPSTVRFDALRSLELTDVFHPMLEFKSFIDCPNLECLTARWNHCEPWNLPPWIPDSLSELELDAVPECNIPDFGGAIRPSVLTINLSGDISYLELFAWIKNCIDSLPFPDSIQSLTINVTNSHFVDDHSEGLYPTPFEYEELSHFLYKLYEQGGLEDITLSITMDVNFGASDSGSCVDEAREVAKLETSFAPLLEENVLDVEFLLQRPNNDGMPEPIMHCSIEKAEMETD